MENKTILIALGVGAAALFLINRKPSSKKVKDNPRMLTLPMFNKTKGNKKVRGNPTGVCNFGSSRLSSNPEINGLNISKGNAKIGNSMLNWSLPQGPPKFGGSCPGSSPWCQSFCYAASGQVAMQRPLYTRNLEESKKPDFADRMIGAIRELGGKKKPDGRIFRIHVSGDFYSPKYVNDWVKIAKTLAPEGWKFYTYTRCWRPEAEAIAPGIQAALRTLQSQPNMNIMASTDPSTGKPPSGWREAGVDGGWTGNTVMCLAQDPKSRFNTCFECRLCYRGSKGIYLNTHGVWKNSPKKQALHQSMLREAIKRGFHLAPGIEKPNPRKKRKDMRRTT